MKSVWFIIVSFFLSCFSFGQMYHTNKPIEIKGQQYDATLYLPSNMDSSGNRIVSISLQLLLSNNANAQSAEHVDPYRNLRLFYRVDSNYNNNTTINILRSLSSAAEGPFMNYTRCYVKKVGKEVKVQLSNGMDAEKIKLHFDLVESDLYTVQPSDMVPENPSILLQSRQKDINATEEKKVVFGSVVKIAGNIDNPAFPDNLHLYQLLKNNDEFIFKMTMDLYLDMMRFKAINHEYNRNNIKNFLLLHDLYYLRYEKNESILNSKVDACVKLLRAASKRFNAGDIFYKDYPVQLTKEDIRQRPLLLIKSEPDRDDYFGAKRVKGEPDYYYEQNGLNVYLSNWKTLSDPGVRSFSESYLNVLAERKQELTLRIYFIIQPRSAFSEDGSFKGVTAYGLKGLLFRDCPSNFIASIDNNFVGKIEEPNMRYLYDEAIGFLNKAVKGSQLAGKINDAEMARHNFSILGNWHRVFDDCQEGYSYLSAIVSKVSTEESMIIFKLLTNYNCTMQPGYELTFSNRFTEQNFSFPVDNVTIVQNPDIDGYYTLSIKLPKEKIRKMIAANVNSLAFQCQGKPRYKMHGSYVLPYPGAVINVLVDRISAPIAVDDKGFSQLLIKLLKDGL